MIDENQAAVQPAKKPNLIKIFTIFLSAGIFVAMAAAIAYLVYQYYLNGKLIARYQQNITTYETNAAMMVTQQANTDAQLAQTKTDLDSARADNEKNKEKISELQTKVSKLTTEKSSLLNSYSALFCNTRIPEMDLKEVTSNEDVKPLLQRILELKYDEKITSSNVYQLWDDNMTALIDFRYADKGFSTVQVTWDQNVDVVNSIYLVDGSCFFYIKDTVDESSSPNA